MNDLELRVHAPGMTREQAVSTAIDQLRDSMVGELDKAGLEIRPKVVRHEIDSTELIRLNISSYQPKTFGDVLIQALYPEEMSASIIMNGVATATHGFMKALENEGYFIVKKSPRK